MTDPTFEGVILHAGFTAEERAIIWHLERELAAAASEDLRRRLDPYTMREED